MKIDLDLIRRFDRHLKKAGLTYNASIIGGAAITLIAGELRDTNDLDSLMKIPAEIKEQILLFAEANLIPSTWFNDNASRNFKEFVREGQNVFDKILFKGEALTLYAPEPSVLALSKISPMLDRERIDTQDIIGLIEGGFLSRIDFDSALSQFEFSIRYEVDPHFRKKSWELSKLLKTLSKDWFGD